jgi:hypothetical protein
VVQFIRHVVTLNAGHIPPKDLFSYLTNRRVTTTIPPSPGQLLEMLEEALPLYVQMVDPSAEGPAEAHSLGIFGALGELNVIAVRPLLLAIWRVPDSGAGMERVLDLVLRRVVAGGLGTGNVERRLGEAARSVNGSHEWLPALNELRDLDPTRDDFVGQLSAHSYTRSTLEFVRRSVVHGTKTPEANGHLHFIRPRGVAWAGFGDEDENWVSTVGNTVLLPQERRPDGSESWDGVRMNMIPLALGDEEGEFDQEVAWTPAAVHRIGTWLAEKAATIWY